MPKSYKVSVVSGQPNFDSLPVAKITDYPLEPRDYKPFAQSILCVGEREIFLRMWAFEVSPAEGSSLACVLYPFTQRPEQGFGLCITHWGDRAVCSAGPLGEETPAFRLLACHPHNGEDLQGVYWGVTLALPIAAVAELGGPVSLSPGDRIPGNFYKTCAAGRFAHMGSFFRADFPDNPYVRESMCDFSVVGY